MSAKQAFKAFGLALMVALGLTAFGASSASAANLTTGTLVHGKILVLGSTNLKASVEAEFSLGSLLVPALSIEIHCIWGTTIGTTFPTEITNPEGGQALGTFLFEGCQVFPIGNKGELTFAEPLPCNITNTSHHITVQATILVVTHEGVLYLLAEPDPVTEPFTTIEYEKGKGCPIPLKQKLTGTYAFTVTQEHLKVLTINPGSAALQTLLGASLLYGINPASLVTTFASSLRLEGLHFGCSWGVV